MNPTCTRGPKRSSWRIFPLLFLWMALSSIPLKSANVTVMTRGLGYGTIRTVDSGEIVCGGDCMGDFPDGTMVEFEAIEGPNSTFVAWEGASTSTSRIITITVNGNMTLRASFRPRVVPPDINPNQIHPAGIQAYLLANPQVNTAARFISILPDEYRQNWILMTRSESLQTGTAKYPRVLLPSADGRNVFTVALATHPSFPGAHPHAIEYMQYDAVQHNFRFHEIVLAPIPAKGNFEARPVVANQFVSEDDRKCYNCHSTRNVLNSSPFNGTTGVTNGAPNLPPNEIVKSKSKPNWDTYDSWAGMLPFNRDRLYSGSLEDIAFRRIFNLWNWRGSGLNDSIRQVIELLELQPPAIAVGNADEITRRMNETTDAAHLFIRYGNNDRQDNKTTDFNFGNPVSGSTNFTQGGPYTILRHSQFRVGDEGRGVVLFDVLGGNKGDLNQKRVADEIISHQYATGSYPIDVRAIAYAIIQGYIVRSGDDAISTAPSVTLTYDRSFFDGRTGTTLSALSTDTRTRAESLPRRKAEIQRANIDRTFPLLWQ